MSPVSPCGGTAVLVVTEPRDLPLVAVTSLTETLLEVVREESVEDGVDGRVAVLETVGEEDDDDERVALVVAGRFAEIQKYLSQPPLKLFEILGGFPPYKLFSDRRGGTGEEDIRSVEKILSDLWAVCEPPT